MDSYIRHDSHGLCRSPRVIHFWFVLACPWVGLLLGAAELATALVSPSQVGVLNSGIGLAQSLGALVAGPILAAAFGHGLRQGGMGMGLPYMVAATLLFMASCLTCVIHIAGEKRRVLVTGFSDWGKQRDICVR